MPSRSTAARLATILVVATACGDAHLVSPVPQRTFVFAMEAELAAGTEPARSATLWLPVPVADEQQSLGPLLPHTTGGALREAYDDKGNRMLSVRGAPPLRVAYEVEVCRYRVEPPDDDREEGSLADESRWLQPATLTPLDAIRRDALMRTASEIGVLQKARRLYDAVVDEMSYGKPAGGGWGHGALDWIRGAKVGNSTDFHALFVAYCQSVGIPAFPEIGYALPPARTAAPQPLASFHTWAYFLVPGMGWLPVDAAEAKMHPEMRDFYFGGLTQDRVRLSRGRDLVLNPPQQGSPLNLFAQPYAEADGQDVTGTLRWSVRFHDVGGSASGRGE